MEPARGWSLRMDRGAWLLLAIAFQALALVVSCPASAQTGSVAGTVLNAQTGEPLDAVHLSLTPVGQEVVALSGLTRRDGRYLIMNVPPGRYVMRLELIGFEVPEEVVDVRVGQPTIVDFRLDPQPISLSEIVVTGVIGSTQRTKLPFDVVQVRMADLPVPSISAAQSLQGKVAGVQVVQPNGLQGSTPSILLRGITSLNASGRTQDPLYIVDEVIVGADLVDVSALDIQSIEVVKGAAAASLYGSRAANGVIHIRTKRGAELPEERVRYTFRSEFGRSELGRTSEAFRSEAHPYALTPDGQRFLDLNGEPCEWLQCPNVALAGQKAGGGEATEWNTYQINPWPGKTYDQVARFFTNGSLLQNQLTVEGRSGRTNFLVSASHLDQGGIVRYLRGFKRSDFRVNLDQNIVNNLSLQSSFFYSRSSQPLSGLENNAIYDLHAVSPVADLLAKDPGNAEELMFIVGPNNQENPLYKLRAIQRDQWRSRFLGSLTVHSSPADWLTVDGNLSFDRGDVKLEGLWPKGFQTTEPSWLNEGRLVIQRSTSEALNGSLTASARWAPTNRIRNTTQIRYLVESQDHEIFWADGYEFAVIDVPVMTNVNQENLSSESSLETIRADGFFLITNFDLWDRYVVDAVVRNDGSSLFGIDQRRQWYYRLGTAWRVGKEDFFQVGWIDELKLRYSVGTAGGRPRFNAQYQTFDVVSGRIVPNRLGNKDLEPEFSTEHELGLDVSLFDFRAILSLTHARTTTENQILEVPLATFSGFRSQWRNAGTIESDTWEATLDLRLLERADLAWNAKLIFDATRSEITALHTPAYKYDWFYAREGEQVGTFYGYRAATDCGHLPSGISCDGFAVNDDGYLVWIGEGGSFDDPQWGTDGPAIGAQSVKWGTLFAGYCLDKATGEDTQYCPLGNSLPDYNLGLSTVLSWKGFSAYALFSRSAGFDIRNNYLNTGTAGFYDQHKVPEGQRKPIGYFESWYTVGGGQNSSTTVLDGTFTKLRELSLAYRIEPELLRRIPGLNQISAAVVRLSGKNLFTWSDYEGFDPDVGVPGGVSGSAALNRVDFHAHPNMRTFTGVVELVF